MSQLNDIISGTRTVKDALMDGAPRQVVISFGDESYVLATSDGRTLLTDNNEEISISASTVLEVQRGIIQEGSLKLVRKLCTGKELNFGECNAAEFSVDLYNIGDVVGKAIEVYELIEGYRVDLFTGVVESAKLNPEMNYRTIKAYDALYTIQKRDVKEWYDGYFGKVQKQEYKGVWGTGNSYVYPQVVKYNDVYYRYVNTATDEFIHKEGQAEFIENVSQYLTGKTPVEILADQEIKKYIEIVNDYDQYNYLSATLKQFRKDLFEYVGLSSVNTQLINDNVRITKNINSETVLFGTLLQSICQMNAVFGCINESGKFEYVALVNKRSGHETDTQGHTVLYTYGVETVDYSDNYVSSNTTFEEYTTDLIDAVRIFNSDNAMTSYAGALNAVNPLDIPSNPILEGLPSATLDVVSANIYNRVKDVTYTPISMDCKVSLPIDMGSKINFTSHTGEVVHSFAFTDDNSGAQLINEKITSSGNKKREGASKVSDDLQRAIKNTLDIALVDIYERINENGAMIKRLDANSGSYMVEVKRRDEETGSKFEQTANKISWMIKSGTSESNFTLTDRMATLISNSVDITGLVTFKSKVEDGSETVINGGAIKTNTIDGTAIKVTSLTADRFVIASGQNLLADVDSFENITEPYAVSSKVGTIQTAIYQGLAFSGKNSLKVLATALGYGSKVSFILGNPSNYTGRVPVEVNKYYCVSFYMRSASNGIEGKLNVYSYYNETSSSRVSLGSLEFSYDTANVWERFYVVVQAKTYQRMGIEFEFGETALNKEFYIDAVQIEQVHAPNQLPSLFKAGSLTTINGNNIITGSITAKQLATDIIKSLNYSKVGSATGYSDKGTYLDLETGAITSTAFYVDKNGNAGFKGNIEALSLNATTSGKISIFDFNANGMTAKYPNSSQNNIEMVPDHFLFSVYDGWRSSLANLSGVIEMGKSTIWVDGSPKAEYNIRFSSDTILLHARSVTAKGTDHFAALLAGDYGFSIGNLQSSGLDPGIGYWGGDGPNAVITGQNIIFARSSWNPQNNSSNYTNPDVVINKNGYLVAYKTLVAYGGFQIGTNAVQRGTIKDGDGHTKNVLTWS